MSTRFFVSALFILFACPYAEAKTATVVKLQLSQERNAAVERSGNIAFRDAAPMPTPILSSADVERLLSRTVSSVSVRVPLEARAPGNEKAAPLKFAGKLFVQVAPGKLRTCTAQFISPNVLLTAAHCVVGPSGSFYPMTFRQQFRNKKFNNVKYTISCGAYYDEWNTTPAPDKYAIDYVMLITKERSKTGFFNRDFGLVPRAWRAIGYPGSISNGQVIQVVNGTKGQSNFSIIEMKHGVPGFTARPGADGGAWIAEYSGVVSTRTNKVFSLSAFVQAGKPGSTFGPFFGRPGQTLFNAVAGGCR